MQFADLIVILSHYLKEKLNQYDLGLLPDGKTVRWVNNVGWAKSKLIDAGYLSSTVPKGTWKSPLLADRHWKITKEPKPAVCLSIDLASFSNNFRSF